MYGLLSGTKWRHVCMGCVCVVLKLWTAQPPLAEWIRRGQPAHTPPQRPPGAGRKGRNKGRKQFSKPDCTGEGRRNGIACPQISRVVQPEGCPGQ
eukprot:365534-Chlamydomonas_euryale.AAC.20